MNDKITAPDLRVVSDDGANYGVITRDEALAKARESGVDLILISPNAVPPVAKIIDFGKYQYEEQKKKKSAKKQTSEVKGVRVGLGTSDHDLEMKSKKISEFLEDGHRVRIDLRLRGRAKYLEKGFLEERLARILNFVSVEHKMSAQPKKGPRGISAIIERTKSK